MRRADINPIFRACLIGALLLVGLAGCVSDDVEPQAVDDAAPAAGTAAEADDLAHELLTPYRSPSGRFEVSYPTVWTAVETLDGGALVLANSAEAMERHDSGVSPTADDLVINIGFLPAALFEQRELRRFDVTLDLAPDDLFRALLPIFNTVGDATVGDVELVDIADGHQAGAAAISASGSEGRILTFPAGPRAMALVSTKSAPGQSDRYDDVVNRIAASTVFDGDGDALYGQLLTG